MSSPLSYSHVHQRAFTMIELLVVVVVIGILAALMLPIVSAAIDRARVAQCQGNLRQIGVALSSYLAENDNKFPGPLTGAQPSRYSTKSSNTLAMHLAPYMGLPLDGETRVNKYMICPVFKRKGDSIRSYGIGLDESGYPFGYASSNGGREPMSFPAIASRRSPSETWILRDIDKLVTNGGNNADSADEPAHKMVRNYLYLDGSVRQILIEKPES